MQESAHEVNQQSIEFLKQMFHGKSSISEDIYICLYLYSIAYRNHLKQQKNNRHMINSMNESLVNQRKGLTSYVQGIASLLAKRIRIHSQDVAFESMNE